MEVQGLQNDKDKEIVITVLKKLNEEYENHKYFNDGASSRVILLNNKYLIKQNEKNVLMAEVEFLKLNKSKFFQNIIYVDKDYEFVVYEYIEGEIMKSVDNVDDLISKIYNITINYKKYNHSRFGYLNEEVNTWADFLEQEIEYSKKYLSGYVNNDDILKKCIKNLTKYDFEVKLIHGDFGTHNFIKKDKKLVGVIDPMPVIGDPLYDFLFAIVSNVQILTKVTLDKIYDIVKEPKEKVLSMFIIVLYCRMARCIKYHPQDMNTYMKVWNKLT